MASSMAVETEEAFDSDVVVVSVVAFSVVVSDVAANK